MPESHLRLQARYLFARAEVVDGDRLNASPAIALILAHVLRLFTATMQTWNMATGELQWRTRNCSARCSGMGLLGKLSFALILGGFGIATALIYHVLNGSVSARQKRRGCQIASGARGAQ